MAMKIGSGYLYLPPEIKSSKESIEERTERMDIDASKRRHSFGADVEDTTNKFEVNNMNT